MNTNEYIFDLVKTALQSNVEKVSELIRQAARITRLRNDYLNLWWLKWEMVNISDKAEKFRAIDEILPHFTKEQLAYWHAKFFKTWVDERKVVHVDDENNIVEGKFLPKAVGEVEMISIITSKRRHKRYPHKVCIL